MKSLPSLFTPMHSLRTLGAFFLIAIMVTSITSAQTEVLDTRVGMSIIKDYKTGLVKIIDIKRGSWADRRGYQVNDYLERINLDSVKHMSLSTVADLLKKPTESISGYRDNYGFFQAGRKGDIIMCTNTLEPEPEPTPVAPPPPPFPAPEPEPAPPEAVQEPSEFERFADAFARVAAAAKTGFTEIKTGETFTREDTEYEEISVEFPGVVWSGIHEVIDGFNYDDPTDITMASTLHVFFYDGTDKEKGIAVYRKIREYALRCYDQDIGGYWSLLDKTDLHSPISAVLLINGENPDFTVEVYFLHMGQFGESVQLRFKVKYSMP